MVVMLEGIKSEDWGDRPIQRSTAAALARNGQVAYRVVDRQTAALHALQPGEKRIGSRKRSRLRSAKILDDGNRFLCECLIYDRSTSGYRLKLARNISIPRNFRLFDDETREISQISLVWRTECMLGARRCKVIDRESIKETTRAALAGRYYAVPD